MRNLWRFHGQSLCIGVARNGVCLLRSGGWRRAAPEVLGEQACVDGGAGHIAAVGAALAALLADSRVTGLPVTYVLADDLLRLWHVTPPPGVSRLADLEAAAALRFQTLYGEAATGWKLMADWHTDTPFCAAAVPRPLLALLEQRAAAQRLAVVAVLPHFVAAWNRWHGALQAGAWFAQVGGQAGAEVLTLGVVQRRGQLHTVRALAMPSGPDALAALLQREALLLDVPVPELLQVCGALPPAWLRPVGAGPVVLRHLGRPAAPGQAPLSAAAALAWAGVPA